MRRYHVLGVCLLAGFIMGCAVPAHAISAKHRQALEWSGCKMDDSPSECDVSKPKSWNLKHHQPIRQTLNALSSEAESVIGTDIAEGADFLLSQGWKPNNGQWYKAGHILRLVVENEKVVNAQLVK